ncbi:MAG: AMP-binding protein [Deltaproteobacteria bacterium]|nr:AMP-binding protein [Deltaproteobacteria bacterium]
MNRLSIFTCAKKFKDALLLQFANQSYSFNELAAHCAPVCDHIHQIPEERTIVLKAHNHPSTVIIVLAAWHCRRKIALLHGKSTLAEKHQFKTKLADAYFIDDCSQFVQQSRASVFTGQSKTNARATAPGVLSQSESILFTSGSSGIAKGVILPETTLAAAAMASETHLGWAKDDKWILNLPLAHVGGLSILIRCLLAGKCAILHPRFDLPLIFDDIAMQGASMISLVPTTLHRLMASDEWKRLRSLRVILLGGAAASDTLRDQWQRRQLPVFETYGMTETASQVATVPASAITDATRPGLKPLQGVQVDIVDKNGVSMPALTHGRIRILGPTVMRGYLGHPPVDGVFVSADVGYLDENAYLHVLGRADDIIITGGENVYPATVENSLKTVDGIREAVVFGVSDDEYGQLIAAALYVDTEIFSMDVLSASLEAHFPSHQKPRCVYIAPIQTIPLLENKKIHRARIIDAAVAHLIRV